MKGRGKRKEGERRGEGEGGRKQDIFNLIITQLSYMHI